MLQDFKERTDTKRQSRVGYKGPSREKAPRRATAKASGHASIDHSHGTKTKKRTGGTNGSVTRTGSRKYVGTGSTFTSRRARERSTAGGASSSQTSRKERRPTKMSTSNTWAKRGNFMKTKSHGTSYSNMSLSKKAPKRTGATRRPVEKFYQSMHSLDQKRRPKRRFESDAAARKTGVDSDRNSRVPSKARALKKLETPARLQTSKSKGLGKKSPKAGLKKSKITPKKRQEEPQTVVEATEAKSTKLSDYVTQVKPGLGAINQIDFSRRGAVRQGDSPPAKNSHSQAVGSVKNGNKPAKLGQRFSETGGERESQKFAGFYMNSLLEALSSQEETEEFKIYREHFNQTYQSILFLNNIERIDECSLVEKKVYLPPNMGRKFRLIFREKDVDS